MALATVGTAGALSQPPSTAGSYGQGIKYPLEYDPTTGRLKLSSGPQAVLEAVMGIAQTEEGERPMNPGFGANPGLFEPFDVIRVASNLEHQIAVHEPRVDSAEIVVGLPEAAQGQVIEEIRATLRGEATPRTLTYPSFVGP